MSALVGALGSVIGYLGAEVAERAVFERLLWPQRFYHDPNPTVLIKQALLMTMGGPLHSTALATLDVFRNNGLYLGTRRGDMLGTAFLSDIHVPNYSRTGSNEKDMGKESRNGFWVRTMRSITKPPENGTRLAAATPTPYRALHLLLQLSLRRVDPSETMGQNVVKVTEDLSVGRYIIMIFILFLSELSSIAAAVVAGARFKTWWLVVYFSLPIIFKLIAVCFTVRREGLQDDDALGITPGVAPSNVIYEVVDPNRSFLLIKGPATVIQQFFRHYGHPKRDSQAVWLPDRAREVICIIVIYGFVLYFPAGLIAALWMSPEVQYLWLGYELYAILAMHIVRIAGWEGCGRLEEHVARLLGDGHEVWLESSGGTTIAATLVTETVTNQAGGKLRVNEIVQTGRP